MEKKVKKAFYSNTLFLHLEKSKTSFSIFQTCYEFRKYILVIVLIQIFHYFSNKKSMNLFFYIHY
jgi:hypothetical protein